MNPRLFEPLGIQRPTWETDPQGFNFGAGGIFLCVSELAKFIQLHLQGGLWGKRRILTEEWVKEATAKQVEGDYKGHGYGYLFWRGPGNTYRADGKYGQYGVAVPDKKAVIAVNAEFHGKDELLNHIYETIITAL
jgi:CubicO group peptidase (beta-lactamase class C family)